ncbi:MAG: SemiSWEET transporter [Amphritea sp.]
MNDIVSLIGMGAAFCTTLSFVPQVLQIIKSRDTAGISISMYSIFTLGVFLWVVYGFVREDLPVFLANLLTLILTLSVLGLTLKSRLKPNQEEADEAKET